MRLLDQIGIYFILLGRTFSRPEKFSVIYRQTMREVEKVGIIKVRLYRPFSAEHFIKALPGTVKSIAVLDRIAAGQQVDALDGLEYRLIGPSSGGRVSRVAGVSGDPPDEVRRSQERHDPNALPSYDLVELGPAARVRMGSGLYSRQLRVAPGE